MFSAYEEESTGWKELEIDNLPCDILTGDYEFEFESSLDRSGYIKSNNSILHILEAVVSSGFIYHYRKNKPKEPTHEDIMTKWWYSDSKLWTRVTEYNDTGEYCYTLEDCQVSKKYFIDKESADIPLEKI